MGSGDLRREGVAARNMAAKPEEWAGAGQTKLWGGGVNQAEQRACWRPVSEWAWLSWEPAESHMASREPEEWQAQGERTQQPDQAILESYQKDCALYSRGNRTW